MSAANSPINRFRELIVQISDPTQRLILEQLVAELDSRRIRYEQVSGDAQLGVAIAGDSYGSVAVDQSTHNTQTQGGDYAEGYIDKRVIINILLAGDDPETVIAALTASGVTADLKPLLISARQKEADRLLSLLADLSLSSATLRRAFSTIAPFHKLPDLSDHSLLQSIIFELNHNIVSTRESENDPFERFARALLTEPDLTVTQQTALCQWLGLPLQLQHTYQAPGLLIAIEKPHTSNPEYQIRAWRWPDRLRLWPPVGEEIRLLTESEIPQAIQHLYQSIYHYIAHYGGNLRVELLMHHSLLLEPFHEWKVPIIFDENDPDDVAEQALYIAHQVVVRSVERGLDRSASMINARALWRKRWHQLADGCKRNWQRPQQIGATQQPPFFCPTCAEDFAENLFDQLSNDDYLCFVETVTPPESMDFIKKVLLRVIRAGLPLGLWFAHNVDRRLPIYQFLDSLLEPQQLPELPRTVRQYWKRIDVTHPLLFFDDPHRLPYDPDSAGFETPSIV